MEKYIENSNHQAPWLKTSSNNDGHFNMGNLTVENASSQNEGRDGTREWPPLIQSFLHNPETPGCPSGYEQHYAQPTQASYSENHTQQNSIVSTSFKETCNGLVKLEEHAETASSDADAMSPQQQTNQNFNIKDNCSDQSRSSDLKVNNLERLWRNEPERPPPCNCRLDPSDCSDTGPFYTQLGCAPTFEELRDIMEKRTGVSGNALRIEQAIYCNQEGVSSTGCPIAKEIVRRSSLEEKYLIVVKSRPNHYCSIVWQVIAIVVWDGVERSKADLLYDKIRYTLPEFAYATERVCEMNSSKTCACQGNDSNSEGSSYSFGCSWTMFTDGCKFAKSSGPARKFRLSKPEQETEFEADMCTLADELSFLLENVAPKAFSNLTSFSKESEYCRIGNRPDFKRPFSGVTSVMDFCAHAHHDSNNINGGCTMVVTLTRPENREFGVPRDDEQLHVLPKYRIAIAVESKTSGFERLQEYRCIYGVRKSPKKKKETRSVSKWPAPCKDYPKPKHKRPKIMLPKPMKRKEKGVRKEYLKKSKKYSRMEDSQFMGNTIEGNPGASYETPLDYSLQRAPQHLLQSTQYSHPVSENYQNAAGTHRGGPQSFGSTINSPPSTQQGHQGFYVQSQLQVNQQAGAVSGRLPSFSFFNNTTSIPQFDGANDNESTSQGTKPQTSQNMQIFIPYNQHPSAFVDQRQFYPHQSNVNLMLGNLIKQNNQVYASPQTAFDPNDTYWSHQQSFTNTYSPYGFSHPVGQASFFQGSVNKHGMNLNANQITFQMPLPETHESGLLTSPKKYWQISYGQQMQKSQAEPSPMLFQTNPNVGQLTDNHPSSVPEASYCLSIPEPEEPIPDENIVTYEERDNRDKFGDNNINIGGLALALEHGSVLIECARHELHATTALKNPNRSKPTRIGLVFYQHKKLNHPLHGFLKSKEKAVVKMRNDYKSYFDGTFVPTERQFLKMTEHGFVFPEKVLISRSRKPRNNGGKEVPFDAVLHNGEVYVRDNPVLPKLRHLIGSSSS